MSIPLVFTQAQTPERIINITNDISRRQGVVSIKFTDSAWSAMITLKQPVEPNFKNEAIYNNPLLDQLRSVTINTESTSSTSIPQNNTQNPNASSNTTNSEVVPPGNSENTDPPNGENTNPQVVEHSEKPKDSEKEKEQGQDENLHNPDRNVSAEVTLEEDSTTS